jgi:uncharacterized protein (TIGR00255 family)
MLERFEPQIRDWLRTHFPRGHVNFSLRLEGAANGNGGNPLVLDVSRARAYLGLLNDLQRELGLPGAVDVALLSRFGDLFRPADAGDTDPLDAEIVRGVTDAASRAAITMREDEGRRLEADLVARLTAIESALQHIGQRAPARLLAERDRLRRAISDLLGDIGVDEERLAREVAYLAERWDISEELVRLRSHIELFRQTLAAAAEEPVGKRLGFLTQEMHREANTIGSKANDAEIDHRVIAIKEELERLREQIENVE